jgi:hypothetical protein
MSPIHSMPKSLQTAHLAAGNVAARQATTRGSRPIGSFSGFVFIFTGRLRRHVACRASLRAA